MLSNVPMFLGNLTVALLFGMIFCIAWELPFAKLQKLAIGALAAQLSRKPAPRWAVGILVFFILFIVLFVLNFLNHLHFFKLTSAWW